MRRSMVIGLVGFLGLGVSVADVLGKSYARNLLSNVEDNYCKRENNSYSGFKLKVYNEEMNVRNRGLALGCDYYKRD